MKYYNYDHKTTIKNCKNIHMAYIEQIKCHSFLLILIVLLKRLKFLSNRNFMSTFVYELWLGKFS